MKATMMSVGGILVVIIQHCGLDLLIITETKGMAQGKKYGEGEHIHTGDNVGVVMVTTKGELSFVVDGVSLGVAFDGIPLDKPLVPCVILLFERDSVELII